MKAHKQDMATIISQLINRGKLQSAHRIADEAIDRGDACIQSADFWFAVYLTRLLVGTHAGDALARARQCSNFTRQMEGDAMRDNALALIRLRDGGYEDGVINNILWNASVLHAGDANRQAAIVMARARLNVKQAEVGGSSKGFHLTRAYRLFKQADTMWAQIGDKADQQWIRNNRFHWILVAARLHDRDQASRLYSQIVSSSEQRRVRLVRAWLVTWLWPGRLGSRIDDRLQRLINR